MLLPSESEVVDYCTDLWGNPDFGMGYRKIAHPSEEFQARLRELAATHGVRVDFQPDTDFTFLFSLRTKKTP